MHTPRESSGDLDQALNGEGRFPGQGLRLASSPCSTRPGRESHRALRRTATHRPWGSRDTDGGASSGWEGKGKISPFFLLGAETCRLKKSNRFFTLAVASLVNRSEVQGQFRKMNDDRGRNPFSFIIRYRYLRLICSLANSP
jgi:hypothetical protein